MSKWVTDDKPSAIEVNDDDDVDSMFCVGMKVIELYIKKERVVNTSQPQPNVVEYPYYSSQPPNVYTQPPGYETV